MAGKKAKKEKTEKKETGLLSQSEMVRNIRNRLKNEYELKATNELIRAILDIESDEVYMAVAENKHYNYSWGTIGGMSKPPKKVSGKFAENKSVRDNFGYSTWKNGYPYVEWSKTMKTYETRPSREYFELPENRYTTEARIFRKDAKLPEIPEFENLSEEKILEICGKADKLKIDKLPTRKRRNKERDDKYNKIKVLATQDYWKKKNYTPYRATDPNWDGDNRDSVDRYLLHLKAITDVVKKLEWIRCVKDLAEWKHETEDHPELDELEQQFLQEVEEQGLTPITHIKKEIKSDEYGIRYVGEEPSVEGLVYNIEYYKKIRHKFIKESEKLLMEEIDNANNEVNKQNSIEDVSINKEEEQNSN